jgi:hypothetical protein
MAVKAGSDTFAYLISAEPVEVDWCSFLVLEVTAERAAGTVVVYSPVWRRR